MSVSNRIVSGWIDNLLIFVYLVLVFFSLKYPLVVSNTIVFIYGSVVLTRELLRPRFILYFYYCLVLFIVSTVILLLRNDIFPRNFYILTHFGFASILMRRTIHSLTLLIPFYVFGVNLIYYDLVQNLNMNEYFEVSSRNMVGWFALAVSILYYLNAIICKKKIELFTAAMLVFIAILCNGRSTLISSLGVFLLVASQTLTNVTIRVKIIIFSTFMLIILVSYFYFLFFFDQNLRYFQLKQLTSTERGMMVVSYLNYVDFVTFISGVSMKLYPFSLYNNNFHNSYLLGHSLFGIFFFIIMAYIIVMILKKFKVELPVKILMIVYLFRITTDTVAFVGHFDFVLMYALMHLSNVYSISKVSGEKRVLYLRNFNNLIKPSI